MTTELKGYKKYLLPVIHTSNLAQIQENCEIALKAGCKGVFLINHGDDEMSPDGRALQVRSQFDLWVGVNNLKYLCFIDTENADGVWSDDAGVLDKDTSEAKFLSVSRYETKSLDKLYFGGVAFKYRQQPTDLRLTVRNAAFFMDVITTSGPATGLAPVVHKIEEMADEAKRQSRPLAIASGINSDNIDLYLPHADYFLVSTGISSSFHYFDEELVRQLADRIHGY